MISAPIIVPTTLPRPPNRLVPPMIVAVIGGQFVVEARGRIAGVDARREQQAGEAREAARRACRAWPCSRSTRTPIARAAPSLSPIDLRVEAEAGVAAAAHERRARSASRMMTGVGTPNGRPWPR